MSLEVTCTFRLNLKIGRTRVKTELKALNIHGVNTYLLYPQKYPITVPITVGIGRMSRLNARCLPILAMNIVTDFGFDN